MDTAETRSVSSCWFPPTEPAEPYVPKTIRQYVEEEMAEHGESWSDVVRVACPVDVLTHPNYYDYDEQQELKKAMTPDEDGWVYVESEVPFTVWTARRVYFPCHYDGGEWVASVPRDPCDEACASQGGG